FFCMLPPAAALRVCLGGSEMCIRARVGALLFYIWQKPITGGAILGAMILGSIFPIAIS
ncbi:hypothetical protein C9F07_31425, partial [Salmonella enterica subsp. enterica serovar Poona]